MKDSMKAVLARAEALIPDTAMGANQIENVKMVKNGTQLLLEMATAMDEAGMDPTIAAGALIGGGLIIHGGFMADGLEDAANINQGKDRNAP